MYLVSTFFRRAKCFEAAEILKIPSLRDASANDILDKKDLFAHDEIMYKRFKHVVSEIDRTVKGAEALRQKDYPLFGKFMVESHYSLKYVVFFYYYYTIKLHPSETRGLCLMKYTFAPHS